MKFSQHPSFLATLLALSSLNAMATSPKKQSLRMRKLDDSSDGFWGNLGEWTNGVAGSVTESLGDNLQDLLLGTDGDICQIAQSLIGMGESFMGEANCECSGDLDKGVELKCEFDACSGFNSGICGKVGLGFTLGGPDNRVGVSACTEFYDEDWPTDFEEFCMYGSVNYGFFENFDGEFQATYGDQSCMPQVDTGGCVSVDCSRLLPGLEFDSCQFLSMADAEDMNSWFPNFEIFDPDFELEAEIVPWTELDLEHVDFENFNIGDVQWGDSFLEANDNWVDLIGPNPGFLNEDESLSEGVCTMMFQAASLYDEQLGWESSCECDYDEANGALQLICDFSEADCTDKNSLQPCNSVDVTLTYAQLETINANVCIQYAQFPETCYSYDIPFAVVGGASTTSIPDEILPPAPATDLVTPPVLTDCSAQYALPGNTCKCTIDENNCMTVDCTDFEPLAVTDNCQIIDLRGTPENPSKVVLNFKQPGEGESTSDGEGGEFIAAVQESSSSAASMTSRVGAMAMATGLLVAGLFL